MKDAAVSGHLPPLLAWLPILFDPLLSDDKERPDRSGQALEVFGGVIAMSVWGRGVYEGALASPTPLRLPPLLGHVPHALEPSFSEGPLAFESEARQRLRRAFGLPEKAFVVLLVGRNPPSGEANRKSHTGRNPGLRQDPFAHFRALQRASGVRRARGVCPHARSPLARAL